MRTFLVFTTATLLVAVLPAACGSGTSTTGADAEGGVDPQGDGAVVDAAPVPSIKASCMTICAKKAAAACAKDNPADDCQAICESEQMHPTCMRESMVLAACGAAGRVVCSVDQESTPVAPCGPETRALAQCLFANPSGDAGAGDS